MARSALISENIGKSDMNHMVNAEKAIEELCHPYSQSRKRGKWTKDCACEICGFKPWYERDIHTLSFCPNCGADMRNR